MNLEKHTVSKVYKDDENGAQIVELENGLKLELKQYWYESLIEVGDQLSIGIDQSSSSSSSLQSSNGAISIDTSQNFVIVNPDHLITSTELSNAGFCTRKTWLNSRFQFYGESNYSMLLGTLIHCLFQDTISNKKLTKQHLDASLIKLIQQPYILRTLVSIGKTEDNLIKDSREYIASILRFNRKFGNCNDPPVEFDQSQPNLKIRITKVTDIEDTVVAPNFGLKGKIDATMDVKLYDTNDKTMTKIRQQLTPFELKTGKVSFSYAHQAQVSLYTLMIDNSTNKCDFGLLAYLKGDVSMKYVTMTNFVRNDLLMRRNELVHYLKYLNKGPKTRSNLSFCTNCEHLLDCCLLGQLYEPEKIISFQTYEPSLVPETLSHLEERHINFFKRWIDMIYIEERQVKDSRRNFFWNENAIGLENAGKAIAKLNLYKIEEKSYEYKFKRADNYRELGPLPINIQFAKNLERITLSIENDDGKFEKIAFVNGIITSIDEQFVTAQLDEHIKEQYYDKLFRLDVLPLPVSFFYLYTSILNLMTNEDNSKILRELIIDDRKPEFESFDLNSAGVIADLIKNLNNCQQQAVRKSLESKQYLLVNGYPGSGKTETIVHLIKILVKLGKTIVIAAHTNQAVDHILHKLVDHEIDFMRIGSVSRIHPDLITYSEDYLMENCKSTTEVKQLYTSINVFAGTCYSMNSHMIYNMKKINYTIIDEASQLNLAENLIPLFNTEKFILVGDPNQLTPIVNSKKALKAGFGETLFEILMKKDDGGGNNVDLTIQYRMNKEIMRVANSCTYNNKLTCASDEISLATLKLINNDDDDENLSTNWLSKCLSSQIDLSVLFLNTDNHCYSVDELSDDNEIYNLYEVEIVKKIVNNLLSKQVSENAIGIISFYQDQIKQLKSTLVDNPKIEISTIDQYQGKDKEIILVSCVRANSINCGNDTIEVSGILNENRRLNVAITRAKKKLILVGSHSTLNNYVPFKKLFSALKEQQIVQL